MPCILPTRSSEPCGAKGPRGLKRWFQSIFKPTSAKCACRKPFKPTRSKIKVSKPKPCYNPVFVAIPLKYASEHKRSLVVAGRRVPFTPSQVSQWKELRRESSVLFPPIEEETHLCDHCLCKSNATTHEDDDDDEY
ncbi:hypothetical protein SDRG_11338 [Saprolegnia diclina VS20]|uniref:Uncharacterized protein n=1 Tax=Saprolegnia diclina (strain VS20) TaxID=1156394 RepID=T0Q8A6_SAPDV|nr:hypothetical protein SDRG_11338 [Saprolegnia diclina VS20]EQC30856.1 hypothetical protein SDRG_11338 [Saprolegnia diclina VS20]|eukprot:XP_008615594.1 hypothetical protein SDRG_11338 [Saprolegnia diclina VS20]